MSFTTDIIIYFLKTFVMNLYVYYCYRKISNTTHSMRRMLLIVITNFALTALNTYVEFYVDSFLPMLITCVCYGGFLGVITKNKPGYSMIITVISFAINSITMLASAMLTFVPFKGINNPYISLICVLLVQFAFIYGFFRIRKFKNGFAFLNSKLINDKKDAIITYLSISLILIYSLMGTYFGNNKHTLEHLSIVILIIGITMYIMIQRTLNMQYKQTQLVKTLDECKQELAEKDKEIELLSKEKFNTSKIRHEFYHRQQALELLVKENMSLDSNTLKSEVNQNILDIINSLTNEYREECAKVKELPELKKTGILEIDSMFKYMQNECAKNGIEFKLKIIGEIYPLINNIISKSKLETLIGDHIKDAINAVDKKDVVNKEILVILGKKDKNYELAIHDTGVEFEIDTLLKLGKERTTTCSDKGGSGIGFLTTFETMNETKASLIITENQPDNKRYYTKCVTIRFDGNNEYKIISYRASEIENKNKENNILIEKI